MRISISYKHVTSHNHVEVELERHTKKLNKLLKSYEPGLVQLHGAFAKNPRNEEQSLSLNLSMPTGTLHVTGTGSDVRSSCTQTVRQLESEVKKHQIRSGE